MDRNYSNWIPNLIHNMVSMFYVERNRFICIESPKIYIPKHKVILISENGTIMWRNIFSFPRINCGYCTNAKLLNNNRISEYKFFLWLPEKPIIQKSCFVFLVLLVSTNIQNVSKVISSFLSCMRAR